MTAPVSYDPPRSLRDAAAAAIRRTLEADACLECAPVPLYAPPAELEPALAEGLAVELETALAAGLAAEANGADMFGGVELRAHELPAIGDPNDPRPAAAPVVHRAGYGDPGRLERVLRAARAGYSLAGGEGRALVEYYEAQLEAAKTWGARWFDAAFRIQAPAGLHMAMSPDAPESFAESRRHALDALLARVAELDEQLERARFAPLGDNHHNAAACPYCRGATS